MAIHIQTIEVGPIATNCYVVSEDNSGKAFLIDPGIECEPVLNAVANLCLTDILLTHAHFDHMGGAARLIEATGARLWAPEREADWLANPTRNLSAFAGLSEPITCPAATVLIKGGECFPMLGSHLQITLTPGHTPGHVVYSFGDVVFVGDLIFAGSVGRTDFPGGSFKQLLTSITDTIMSLPDDTRLLPGHGPATTVGEERNHNPFLSELRKGSQV
jgi:glyoxylase-like metal-dependent hydrolase (beta-lactamase superfamily II)